MKSIFILFMMSLILFGCATVPTPAAKKIQESDESKMSSCKVLGTVSGNSTGGGWTAEGLKDSAVAEALNKAAELGATHIVWKNIVQSDYGGMATGLAYKCE